MEPTTLTAGAIATLVITKAFEKTGEKLGEKVFEEGGIKIAQPEDSKLIFLSKHRCISLVFSTDKAI